MMMIITMHQKSKCLVILLAFLSSNAMAVSASSTAVP